MNITFDIADIYYERLNMPPTSTPQALHVRFKELATQNHPDAGGNHDAYCRLTEAWGVLGDAKARAMYDRLMQSYLEAHGLTCPRCTGKGAAFIPTGFNQYIARRCSKCQGRGYLLTAKKK